MCRGASQRSFSPFADIPIRVMQNRSTGLALLFGMVVAGVCYDLSADEPAELFRLDGTHSSVRVVNIEDESVSFESAEGVDELSTPDFVKWGRFGQCRSGLLVMLSDGSRIVGRPGIDGDVGVALSDGQFSLRTELWRDIKVPATAVRGVVFQTPINQAAQDGWIRRVERADPTQTTLWLRNQDVIRGTLHTIGESEFRFAVDGRDVTFAADQVVAMRLQQTRGDEVAEPSVVWGLRDGSQLRLRQWRRDGESLSVTTVGNLLLTTQAESLILALSAWQAYREPIVYLSDLEPAAYRHVPLLDEALPLGRDHTFDGFPLRHDGRLYQKGLSMPTTSRVAYTLNGTYRYLQSEIGIDDRAGEGGSVVFRVYTSEDSRQWHPAYESPTIRGGEAYVPMSIALNEKIRYLALIADYADRGDILDYADWLDLRLIR